ncbi:MAG: glycosyltransferase family 2 protein [bacterium]|nr:glycosyltransferase family 2 protein [bacterium]
MKKITIIVPCYNEEAVLDSFYREIKKWFNPNYEMNLLFVNDGSRDKTLEIIKKFAKEDNTVKYISFSRNFGKEAAMQAGLEKSKDKDAVIIMDADLQHPPHLIPEMIKNWEAGYNIIYTKFSSRKGESLLKRIFTRCFYGIFNHYSDIEMERGVKDYQLLDNKVIKAFLALPDNNRFMKGIFSWVGFSKICIPFEFIPRKEGKTKWNFRKLFKYGWNGINQFSNILMFFVKLAMLLVFATCLTETILYFTHVIESYDLKYYLLHLKIDVFMFILLFLIKELFYLTYQNRRQLFNRPIYLIEEESND